MTATRPAAGITSPAFAGDPTAPTAAVGDADTSIATTGFVSAAIAAQNERGLILGKGGTLTGTLTDTADFPLTVPFDCTLKRMKVVVKTAVSGAMVVQLRRVAGPVTTAPTYADVTGFTVTYSSSNVYASADPTDVDVSEGDVLNFSCSTTSGANIIIEVVAVPR